jgi:tRNA(His) 5'-end guanylyltransferase
MKDALGTRMKEQYESRTKYFLPRRTYTLIRLDGKAFHTFTKGFERPYDKFLMDAMDYTTKMLCENVQGCKVGYVQSDEISLLLTDFDKITTSAYFDNNIQKIASITASMATAFFNEYMRDNGITKKLAFFDSRVFSISDPIEVENYFVWRQTDAVRNSISMTAQSLYSHKELNGKSTSEMQDMCMEKGVNWNDQPTGFKRGRMCVKEQYEIGNAEIPGTLRTRWVVDGAIWITKDRERFSELVPRMNQKVEMDGIQ